MNSLKFLCLYCLLFSFSCVGVEQDNPQLLPLGMSGPQSLLTLSVNSSASRKDYVRAEVQAFNAFIMDSAARTAKYADMMASPFSFYRATAHLFYKDLSNGTILVPSNWPGTVETKTWIQGDSHSQNIGFFDNNSGAIKVDLNDFDEAYVGPFYWDLLRFAGGIYLLRNESTLGFNLTTPEAQTEVDYFLQKYQDTLAEVNGNSAETTMELTQSQLDGFTLSKRNDLSSSKSTATLLAKWTTLDIYGKRIFDLSNVDLAAPTSADTSDITNNWADYKTSLGGFATGQSLSYFTIKSIALRINSGLGSRGVKKIYVLIEGTTTSQSDDIILEAKEERSPAILLNSSISTSQYNSWFSNHAIRSKTANKAMGVKVDNHTGALLSATRSYLLRQISPFKFVFDSSDFMSQNDYHNFVKFCARATAYGHARADKDYNTGYVSYNAENGILNAIAVWPSAKTTMRNLAQAYADQVLQDYTFFVDLVNSGQLQ